MSALKSRRQLVFLEESTSEHTKFYGGLRSPSYTGTAADVVEGPAKFIDSFPLPGSSPGRSRDQPAAQHREDPFPDNLLTLKRSGHKRNAIFEDSPLAKRSRSATSHAIEVQRSSESTFRKHVSDSAIPDTEKTSEGRDLIGDFSRPCSLPTILGNHPDILTISPDALAEILTQDNHNVLVVDCRYPYEYEGGHIAGAKNLYTQAKIMEEFLADKKPLTSVTPPRQIIVFHCEFSIKRGPGLLRFLRAQDRALNEEAYPALYYPEVYILQDGYTAFWEFCSLHKKDEVCKPNSYRKMLDVEFKQELLKYESNTKSKKMQRKENRRTKTALAFGL